MPKTNQKKRTSSSTKRTTNKAVRPAKPTKQELERSYKIKYELKMIALIAVTLFMMLSLYTTAVGVVGHGITNIVLGLFSFVGYSFPIVFFIIIFVQLNPNFRPARLRINVALALVLIGLLLLSTLIAYDGIEKQKLILRNDYLTGEGLKQAYELGMDLNGGGVFGDVLTISTVKLIGIFGAYIAIIVSFIAGFIIFTRVSLQDLWEMKKKNSYDRKLAKEQERAIEASIIENKKAEKLENEKRKDNKINAPIDEQDVGFLGTIENQRKSRKKDVKSFDFDSYDGEPKTAPVNSERKVEAQQKMNRVGVVSDPYQELEVTAANDQVKQATEKVTPAIKAESINASKIVFQDHTERNTEAIKSDTVGRSDPIPKNDPIMKDDQAGKISVNKPDQINVTEKPEKIKESDIDPQTRQLVNDQIAVNTGKVFEAYTLPPVDMLNHGKQPAATEDKNEYLEMAKQLEDTLNNFNVDAKVISVKRGPSITMFEVQPSPGVKVSKVVSLSDDIALNLATTNVRIAPIPNKAAIGIEVPNRTTSMVTLKEVITSGEFKKQKSKLTVGLGKDISGNAIIGDLATMPHLLIAGATGSGKSVCVNTIITSILFNAKPDEVKFLMIDPKVVELSNYNGIPHLILPVVTDPKKASIALNWAVNEMTRRYKLFAEQVVRDMKSYNKKAEANGLEMLPQIVVIIDELADLMMVAPNQVEDAICRLAQMARAAGIHLIVATQRPSVDVITGLIKANIPSRIAFSVSSQVDSRTIIDMGGAEKLLGKGDMLFYPNGVSKPKRAQGAFVSDEEVESLVNYIKEQNQEVVYNEEILDEVQSFTTNMDDVDEYLEEAINFVVETGQASASMMQRRFRVGYNRAARLVEAMEERGIVGPHRGSKPREVLISRGELDAFSSEAEVEETFSDEAFDFNQETNYEYEEDAYSNEE